MLVVIRGAGDIATGVALRLWRAGIQVAMTDLEKPTAIRRTVAFSQAIVHGEAVVEGVTARRAESPDQALELLKSGVIPVLADPEGACVPVLKPAAVVDAILAKKNLGTNITDAPVVIGVGPGFTAGTDCHAVVETMRGHTLGRALYEGSALHRRLRRGAGPPGPGGRGVSPASGHRRPGEAGGYRGGGRRRFHDLHPGRRPPGHPAGGDPGPQGHEVRGRGPPV